MWRAYANGAGVALVMNNTPFVATTDELKAYSVPVLYLTDVEFGEALDSCLDSVEANAANFKGLQPDTITNIVFWWLIFLAVSLKHPAFQEEREWRVIYLPPIARSPVIHEAVESIGGVPQIVQKIPLKHDPSVGLHGADVPSLLASVIIGPSEFPLVIRDALIAAMREAKVGDPESKVLISWIPLRGYGLHRYRDVARARRAAESNAFTITRSSGSFESCHSRNTARAASIIGAVITSSVC